VPKKVKKTKENKVIRTPVVAVMGHVDHGKTSFLDAIQGSRVAEKEAGGITQNTRAHDVMLDNGFRITFIDTPGHEAFSKMRERGAKVTDFVLLIVAADDGVQPQTKESIEFAKRDGVPIIVAINKIDIPGINLQKIKSELASGETLAFEISAKEKTGLKELLEGIQLLSEVNELKSKETKLNALAEAFVLESSQDKKIGNTALCILRSGDLSDRAFGVNADQVFKVRAYLDHSQKNVKAIQESQPFWILGLKSTVNAGYIIYFAKDEKEAQRIQNDLKDNVVVEEEVEEKIDKESLFAQMLMKREEVKQGLAQKELHVVVKSSSEGTLEAILSNLQDLSNDDSKVNILFSGVGAVTEDDITRASLAKALVLTFQLPISSKIATKAKQEKVLLRNYEVIYEMFDEVADVLDGLLQPLEEDIETARARIKQVFTLSNGDSVAGSEVLKGNLIKGYKVWVERGGEELARGKITSLRVRKDEVKEVKKGQECGIVIDPNITELQEGDEVVAYKVEKY
jgi:translation initiation factor IF-2